MSTTTTTTTPALLVSLSEPKPSLVIEPVSGFRSLQLSEVWEFRDLFLTLGMRDVKLFFRWRSLGEVTLSLVWMTYSIIIAMTTFIVSAFAFRGAERGFADVI